ncbi:MAG: hypothetical protein UV18_C0005G0121 [Candidatus Magasanikbacteria bacterium GW2011_GWC2_42_27]|uniref:Uncharacterized protein n=1 Tax=Candidatus Magasanikbacteria bacterium GW2011_GWE2_42_7 TaxID=1619052 RepID=A0A0G1EC14_9BACT|nr:MAG: hypothetical protein UV18_C0005G0121 [Candidatus Magasanikbacteria bacterium GW2011_GWC2_42_27]KKS72128.1 MAG: hypothetical protein UV42_C0013G0006 [Candidatus Magasanikbacteria bacterium GW2011_GWE2_42_7]KKT25943.1 MAG: hypothetical protein UW10_C0003G0104 [Candidatus Magasanikbacteria bacterium GW2011_GWA2_43_9]
MNIRKMKLIRLVIVSLILLFPQYSFANENDFCSCAGEYPPPSTKAECATLPQCSVISKNDVCVCEGDVSVPNTTQECQQRNDCVVNTPSTGTPEPAEESPYGGSFWCFCISDDTVWESQRTAMKVTGKSDVVLTSTCEEVTNPSIDRQKCVDLSQGKVQCDIAGPQETECTAIIDVYKKKWSAILPTKTSVDSENFLIKNKITNLQTSSLNPIRGVTVQSLLGRVIQSLLQLLGSISLLVFIYGGVLWMTAHGKAEQTGKAMATILWGGLGIVVIFASYAIVGFVLQVFL